MEQQNTSVWKSSMTCGLYMGIALIIYSVILYVAGLSFNKYLGYVSFLIMIVGIIWAQTNFKKNQGGFMTYGQGVGLATALMLFAGIISAIYTFLLYKVIDPDLYQQFLLFQEEMSTAKLIERGMSEDQIAQAISMSQRFQTPGILAIGTVISSVIGGVIIGLITSIFTSKKLSEEVE